MGTTRGCSALDNIYCFRTVVNNMDTALVYIGLSKKTYFKTIMYNVGTVLTIKSFHPNFKRRI